MKKQLLILAILMFGSIALNAQQATNFNCNDCSGTPYDLFSELDAGKVIVLCWVMPCGSCINPSQLAYNVVKDYQSTHPGMVQMYIIDDFANTSCNDLNNWCDINGLDSTVRFSNALINMNYYGSYGMPKTVVVAGAWRKVYFNQNNSVNTTMLKNEIDLALTETSVHETSLVNTNDIKVSPNPVSGQAVINVKMEEQDQCTINLFNVSGQRVKILFEGILPTGEFSRGYDFSLLPSGIYYLIVRTSTYQRTVKVVLAD